MDVPFVAYEAYRPLPAWDVIDRALHDMEENQDIAFTTVHDLVVGYVVQQLVEAGIVPGPP